MVKVVAAAVKRSVDSGSGKRERKGKEGDMTDRTCSRESGFLLVISFIKTIEPGSSYSGSWEITGPLTRGVVPVEGRRSVCETYMPRSYIACLALHSR